MSKKELLDPLSSVGRMIMLYFRPVGTRISINDHTIKLQVPEFSQGIWRYFSGDNRDDISSLFPVIQRLIEWFIIPLYEYRFKKKKASIKNKSFIIGKMEEKKKNIDEVIKEEEPKSPITQDVEDTIYLKLDDKNIEEYWKCIEKLTKYLCCGLSTFQKTYESGNVIFSLQYYIILLKDSINGTYNSDRLPECLINKEDTKNFLDYNKIKNLWDYNKVKELSDLYEKCFLMPRDESVTSDKTENTEGYLKAIEHLLDLSDGQFRNLISGVKSG